MAANYDGHDTKRQRTDTNGYSTQGKRDNFEDQRKVSPSPVVHCRGLSDNVVEGDLVDALQHFGAISYVIMMPRRKQALVEFEDISGSTALVQYTENNPVYVGGRPAHFNYSTSQKIQRPQGGGEDDRGNNVLLASIMNAKYNISVDVIHTICSPHGNVNRIVIFKKTALQCMIEFDSIEAAKRAKAALNGADIYSGCCTLKIEYAKTMRLNVYKNDAESWDYTNPSLGMGGDAQMKSAPLLDTPRYGAGPTQYTGEPEPRGPPQPQYGGGAVPMNVDYNQPPDPYHQHSPYGRQQERYGGPPPQMQQHQQTRYQPDPYGSPPPGDHYGNQRGYQDNQDQSPGMLQQGAVLMVYGLDPEKMNAQKLFNLFCLYGNVVRVKFLRTKEGTAMIQMGDPAGCERAMKNLHGSYFFNSRLQLAYSKQAFLQDVPNPHTLKDDTPSFVDFMGNRNNRFTTPDSAAKNRIQPPSKVLYFFNAPATVTEEQLNDVFIESDVKPPAKIKQFPTRSEKSSTGLLEWENRNECLEAMVACNHAQIPNPTGKHPYVLKLCFSDAPIREHRGDRNMDRQTDRDGDNRM